MAKFTQLFRLLFLLLFISQYKNTLAQINIPAERVRELINNNTFALNLSSADTNNIIVTSAYHDQLTNSDLVYLQQSYKGIPVYNSIQTVAFRDGKVYSVTGVRIQKIATKVGSTDGEPAVQTLTAIVAAAKNINLNPIADAAAANLNQLRKKLKIEYGRLGISKRNITVELLWVPQDSGKIRLSWQVKIVPFNSDDYWLIHVDAKSGKVLGKANLTVYEKPTSENNDNEKGLEKKLEQQKEVATTSSQKVTALGTSSTYRVIPFPAESMIHPNGYPSLVTDPWNMAGVANPATSLGWQNDGAIDYNITRGNNVWVKEDRADDDESTIGKSATSTSASPTLTFDFLFDSTISPLSPVVQNFAMTNLFYWNNIVHDIIYQYGFDEVSGNFQNNNQGRGGKGGDYVLADAQDGGGTNNANFSIPPDGEKPRMQMYLFSPSPRKTLFLNSPADVYGHKYAPTSDFGNSGKLQNLGPLTADVMLYGSPTNTSIQGCSTATANSFAGKVVLIYRGNCNYTVKVKNAQNAGAVAVIMVNNIAGDPVTMGGTDTTITIPAVMVSQSDGNKIRDLILAGQTVNITLKKGINLDGDLDNGIIIHEYGHGISDRLTGGPAAATCLENQEQMGEGWSDYYALMLTTDWGRAQVTDGTTKRPLATYVDDLDPVNSVGIRTYPYSTDMTINPWTYSMLASSTGGEVHNIGEIWATVLWDMTWDIIKKDGIINTNLYNASGAGGNTVSMKLVTTALKLQACSPGFIDGRNAILKANSLLYNGKYSCVIWNAFARRGMGVNANQGSSNSYTDQVTDNKIPSGVILKKYVDKQNASENEEITYNLKSNCQCSPISNYSIVDTLPSNVSYISGGSYNPSNRTVSFNIPALSAMESITFALKVRVNNATYTPTSIVLNEPVTSSSIPAKFIARTNSPYPENSWNKSTTSFHSSPLAFKAVDTDSTSEQVLTSDSVFALSGVSTLSFWHKFNTEAGYDGGIVEISTDTGKTWLDAGPDMYQNGYNSVVDDVTETRRGFSGSSSNQFIETKVSLANYRNKTVKIRFRFVTDVGTGGDGWYVDDIILKNEAGVYNVAKMFNAATLLQTSADTVTIIRNPASPFVWTGTTNTNWHTATNWSTLTVPNQYVSVLIDTVANQPILSTDANCLDLTLKNATSLTTGSHTLSVYGSLNNSGAVNVSPSGNIKILGTKQQSAGGLHTKQQTRSSN